MLIFETRISTNSDSAITEIFEYENIIEFKNKYIESKLKHASCTNKICHIFLTLDKNGNEIDEIYTQDNWTNKSKYLNQVFDLMINKLKLKNSKLYEKYKDDLTIYNTLEIVNE